MKRIEDSIQNTRASTECGATWKSNDDVSSGNWAAAWSPGFYSSGRNYAVMVASAKAAGSSFLDNILDFECMRLNKIYIHCRSSTVVARWLIRGVGTLIEAMALCF